MVSIKQKGDAADGLEESMNPTHPAHDSVSRQARQLYESAREVIEPDRDSSIRPTTSPAIDYLGRSLSHYESFMRGGAPSNHEYPSDQSRYSQSFRQPEGFMGQGFQDNYAHQQGSYRDPHVYGPQSQFRGQQASNNYTYQYSAAGSSHSFNPLEGFVDESQPHPPAYSPQQTWNAQPSYPSDRYEPADPSHFQYPAYPSHPPQCQDHRSFNQTQRSVRAQPASAANSVEPFNRFERSREPPQPSLSTYPPDIHIQTRPTGFESSRVSRRFKELLSSDNPCLLKKQTAKVPADATGLGSFKQSERFTGAPPYKAAGRPVPELASFVNIKQSYPVSLMSEPSTPPKALSKTAASRRKFKKSRPTSSFCAEPVTPPLAKSKKRTIGARKLANLALAFADSDEEVLKPIRRRLPSRSPTPSESSDFESNESRAPTPPRVYKARLEQQKKNPEYNPDWSDADMSPPLLFKRYEPPLNMNDLNVSFPYIDAHPRIDLNQVMLFATQPPPPPAPPAKKRKRRKAQNIEDEDVVAPTNVIAPLPGRGQGYGMKSSAEKYADRVKELREAGRIKAPKEIDRVRYEFTDSLKLPPMTFKTRQRLGDAKMKQEGEDAKDEKKGAGVAGVKKQRKLVKDKDKVKRKYKFKQGRPVNPRKVDGEAKGEDGKDEKK